MSWSTSSPARLWEPNDGEGNVLPDGRAGCAFVSKCGLCADHPATGVGAEDQYGTGEGSRLEGGAWPRDLGGHREEERQERLRRRDRAARGRREGRVRRYRDRPGAGDGGLMKRAIANRVGVSGVLAILVMLLVPSIVAAQ